MRLIDADKLRMKCHTVNDLQPDKFVVSRMMVSGEVIDAEPTIKAIPIEWVKKFRNQFETTDDYYNVIDYMLQLWEKENE